MTLSRFPYHVGQVVSGTDIGGKPFTGTVTRLIGPYIVLLDDAIYTPNNLIDTPAAAPEDNDVFG